METNFSSRLKNVISFSKEEALRLGHDSIGTEHLILGVIREGEGKAIKVLGKLNIDIEKLREKIEILNPINFKEVNTVYNKKNLFLTTQAEKALKITFLESKVYKSQYIGTIHLLLSVLKNEKDPITKMFKKLDITYDKVKEKFLSISKGEINHNAQKHTTQSSVGMPFDEKDPENRDKNLYTSNDESVIINKKTKTPVLNNFGRDLTLFSSEK